MNYKMDVARNQERSKKTVIQESTCRGSCHEGSSRLIDPPRFVDSGDTTVQRSHSGTDSPHRLINTVRSAEMLL